MAISQRTERGEGLADRVPNQGWIRCRPGGLTPGVGRWDAAGAIFRCIVVCDTCGLEQCNKRMWHILDTHGIHGHTCNECFPRAKGSRKGGSAKKGH